MSERPRLTYFATRGRGETIRLLLELSGQEYDDRRVTFAEWPSIKSSFRFGQLPVYDDQSVSIPQTAAICRYLAAKHGFYGQTDIERAQIDVLSELVLDFQTAARTLLFDAELATSDDKKEQFRILIRQWFGVFEREFKSNASASGFLFGASVTLADVALFSLVDNFVKPLARDEIEANQSMSHFLATFRSLPQIAAYLASDRRPATSMVYLYVVLCCVVLCVVLCCVVLCRLPVLIATYCVRCCVASASVGHSFGSRNVQVICSDHRGLPKPSCAIQLIRTRQRQLALI
jgi:glutathione S-transferase